MKSGKNQQLFVALLVVLLLMGCAGTQSYFIYNVDYNFQLKVADRKVHGQDLRTNIGEISARSEFGYAFRDSLLNLVISPTRDKFMIGLSSESAQSIQLQEDSLAFIDIRGRLHQVNFQQLNWKEYTTDFKAHRFQVSGKIYPLGERGSENGSPERTSQKSKSIGLVSPQFGAVQDTAVNNDTIRVSIRSYLDTEASQNVGRMIGIILPVEVNGTTYEYTFWFEVMSYSIRSPRLAQTKVR